MKYTHACLQIGILISAIPESFTITQTFKAKLLTSGKFQIDGAVGSFTVRSLATCSNECFQNKKCMTFIYNKDTKQCILHSKTFKYSQPKETEAGWKMYLLTESKYVSKYKIIIDNLNPMTKWRSFVYNADKTWRNSFGFVLSTQVGSRCPSDIDGFMHYRHLDLCYNFNPEHFIDYPGHIKQICSSYGGELLRIDSQARQTYIGHVLEGRTTLRVAIQGHSYNPGFAWKLDDGNSLPFTHWCSGAPLVGQFYLQIFRDNCWTEQYNYDQSRNNMFLCERRP